VGCITNRAAEPSLFESSSLYVNECWTRSSGVVSAGLSRGVSLADLSLASCSLSLNRVRANHANDYRELDFLPLLNVDFEGFLRGTKRMSVELDLFKSRVN